MKRQLEKIVLVNKVDFFYNINFILMTQESYVVKMAWNKTSTKIESSKRAICSFEGAEIFSHILLLGGRPD